MARVTFEMFSVVHVEVLGEPHPKGFPRLPIDGGLINRLNAWMTENNIHSAGIGGSEYGGGRHICNYSAENAERIRARLIENGAIDETPRPPPKSPTGS